VSFTNCVHVWRPRLIEHFMGISREVVSCCLPNARGKWSWTQAAQYTECLSRLDSNRDSVDY